MLERRAFGRTGHLSSRVIFGAAALGRMRQERADELLATLEEFGVNHIDVAADYGDAELRLAPWLATRRATFFVATKTSARDGSGARASLERSVVLERDYTLAELDLALEDLARTAGVDVTRPFPFVIATLRWLRAAWKRSRRSAPPR